ncbi:MAG TPA: hypothetical protein VMM36_00440 [Opitutaceae bacterium]|nr:hypothetical protein [Opitutaceae bacterium]
MNKIAITSVLALMTGLAGAPQTAQARGDEALAAVGGFIGGVLVASAVNQHYSDHDAYYGYDAYNNRYPVDYRHDRRDYRRDYGRDHRQWVTVRVWVPGRWVIRHDGYGRRERFYVRGHYEHRREYVRYDGHRRGYGRRG